jgi:two-component system, chemotaxis family, CheB/CheR fusion protein
VLFLGTSETVGDLVTLFSPVDRKSKIYMRKRGIQGAQRFDDFVTTRPGRAAPLVRDPGRLYTTLNLNDVTQRALLEHYATSCVLVNTRGDILHIHGRTGRYLEPTPGDAGMNILQRAREGLRRDLTTTLQKAVAQKNAACQAGIKFETIDQGVVLWDGGVPDH